MVETSKLKFSKTHEWVNLEGQTATIGITDHAQSEISDVVFVELPRVGATVRQFEPACVVESVKAAFDIYAPMSGVVVKVNDALRVSPEFVNQSPYENGWLFQIDVSSARELDSLMTEEQYQGLDKHPTH